MTIASRSEASASQHSYSHMDGFDFLWDPKQKERAEVLLETYGKDTLKVWLRYVIEGGARDMYEYTQKYRGRIDFCRIRGWTEGNSEDLYKAIRNEAQDMASKPDFRFLYCPFMKKRAIDLIACGVDRDALSEVLCFVITGRNASSFQVSEKDKNLYLRKMGIFP